MNVIASVLFLFGFVQSQFLTPSEEYIDIGDNREKIVKMFEKVSTLNVMLENHQSLGNIRWMEELFEFGLQTFLIFNILNGADYDEWLDHCRQFHDNSVRTLYHERFYQKNHDPHKSKNNYNSFDDYGLEANEYTMDQQAHISPSHVKLHESFAKFMDRWFTYRKSGFIIFCSFDVLEVYLGCLVNRGGTFLFIINETFGGEKCLNVVFEILKRAWKASTNCKLYVLIFNNIYALDPFAFDTNSKSFGTIEKVSNDNIGRDFKKLNSYNLNVEIFQSAYSNNKENSSEFTGKLDSFVGPDVNVANFIQQQMNASMTVVKNQGNFGVKLANGTLTGALGNLQKRNSDIALTAFFLKDYDTRACEFTYPLYMDQLCVVVKKAARIPHEILPLVVFEQSLWLSLFCMIIMISIVWSCLRSVNSFIRRPPDSNHNIEFYVVNYNFSRFQAQQSQLRQYTQVFIDTWLLFLSIPLRKFTRIQSERVFISSIALYSLIILSIYQSLISTVFVKPLYFKDIVSLTQLDSSGIIIKVKYPGYLTDVFPNDTDSPETYKSLHKKMKLIDTKIAALDIVRDFEDTATITRKSTLLLDNSIYFMKKQLHLIDKECPKNYFLAYMVPTHSLYLERINEILFDIQRYGFIKKWINDANFRATLETQRSMRNEEELSMFLQLNELKFPFFVLVSGNCFGMLSLLTEVLVFSFRVRNRK